MYCGDNEKKRSEDLKQEKRSEVESVEESGAAGGWLLLGLASGVWIPGNRGAQHSTAQHNNVIRKSNDRRPGMWTVDGASAH